jgi:hypothetical protein
MANDDLFCWVRLFLSGTANVSESGSPKRPTVLIAPFFANRLDVRG